MKHQFKIATLIRHTKSLPTVTSMDRTSMKFGPPSPIDAVAHRTISNLRRLFPNSPPPSPSPSTRSSLSTSKKSRNLSSISTFTPSLCSLSASSTSISTCDSNSFQSPCAWAMAILNMLLLPSAAHARSAHPNQQSAMDSIMQKLLPAEDDFDEEESLKSKMRKTIHKAADRIIAIGDVHGDLEAMRIALLNARVIDEEDNWIGGKSVLVQVGDQLDRGNKERDIYKLLFKLQDIAPSSGGSVHILLGNHELMNARLDFRYVTSGGFADFKSDKNLKFDNSNRKNRINSNDMKMIRNLPPTMQPRAKAIVAGGQLAHELSTRTKLTVVVGDTLFVHGGLSPKHLLSSSSSSKSIKERLEEMNMETMKFLKGEGEYPDILQGGHSPVWMRDYSRPGIHRNSKECKMLDETLNMVGVKRMVVGHTPQSDGINAACGGKVWRIDTGMAKAYGGVPEAIEISKRGNVKILTPTGTVQGSARLK